jgi:uncharacterized membrane protein
MHADARKEAQKRVDRVTAFRKELAELAREGGLTLTAEQQSGLDAHLAALLLKLHQQYGVDATESARRVSWGMRIVSLLGAAAMLAAGILLLHRVWGHLSTPLQVVMLTSAPLVLLFASEIACRRRADPYYVGLLALAAGVAFVVEMSAMGTVLNQADTPWILLAWGCFAVLMAYAYGLRLLFGIGLLLLCAWSAAMVLHTQGYHWVDFMQRSQLLMPSAAIVYSIPWLLRGRGPGGFGLVYRLCGAGVGLLSLLVLSTAGDLCCCGISPGTVAAAYQLIGLLAGVAVLVHGLRSGQAALMNLGALAFIVFLFVRLHSWWWNWMPKYLFCFVLGLIAFGSLLVFRRIRSRISKGVAL